MLLLLSSIIVVACFVGLLCLQQQSNWFMCCSFRREFLMLEGIHEVSKGIASEDFEAAAGALMEHFQRMSTELKWQDEHTWSVRHPLRMPDKPDFQALLKRDRFA